MQNRYEIQRNNLGGKINLAVDRDRQELAKTFLKANNSILKNKYSIASVGDLYDLALMDYMEKLKLEIGKMPPYNHITNTIEYSLIYYMKMTKDCR